MKKREDAKLKKRKDERRGRFILKMTSVLVSFFLWFYVLNSAPIEVEKEVGVFYILPQGHALNVELPQKIKVTMKGPRAFLFSSYYDNKKIYINFDSPEFKGRRYFDLKINEKDIPHNLTVDILKIQPSEMRVALTKKLKKIVPVKALFNSSLEKNFKLESFRVVPTQIEIEGPLELVKKIDKIETEMINVQEMEGKEEILASLNISDSRLRIGLVKKGNSDLFVDQVRVLYKLRPKKANLILKNIAIDFQVPEDLYFRPERNFVSLSVFTFGDHQKGIPRNEVRVSADIPKGSKGVVRIPLKATLPEGVHLLQIYPEYINVMANKVGSRKK